MFDFLNDKKTYNYMKASIGKDDIIYVDSNIFMDADAQYFFDSLKSGNNILMPKEQYNELYKLKKSDDHETSFKARETFRLLENLLDKKILTIENLNDETKIISYADPIFIQEIINKLKSNIPVIFITEDRDLRLRLKVAIEQIQNSTELIKFYTLDDIKKQSTIRNLKTPIWKKTVRVAAFVASMAPRSAFDKE